MKLKFLTLFSILALAASVFAESAMSNITINLRYTGKNGAAKKFAEEMVSSGTVAKIRAEKGNIRYEYFQSLDDPETILLIDAWESQAAIDVHHHERHAVDGDGVTRFGRHLAEGVVEQVIDQGHGIRDVDVAVHVKVAAHRLGPCRR